MVTAHIINRSFKTGPNAYSDLIKTSKAVGVVSLLSFWYRISPFLFTYMGALPFLRYERDTSQPLNTFISAVCRTTGQMSVCNREVLGPAVSTRVFLVFLRLEVNAETFRKFPVATECVSCSPSPPFKFIETRPLCCQNQQIIFFFQIKQFSTNSEN